jgi:AcrR family transcriptional regulator
MNKLGKVYGNEDENSMNKQVNESGDKKGDKAEHDRRSQRTRRLLSHALIQLMQEKRYDKITVQDIIDRADVGRSTFYAHYLDKEDLLLRQFEEVLDLFSQHLELDESRAYARMNVKGLFRHVQEFQPVYEAMVWGRGIELLYQQGQNFLSKRIEADFAAIQVGGKSPTIPVALLATHIASTLVTLLRWWLENKMPYSVERMDEIFHQLVMPGVHTALHE